MWVKNLTKLSNMHQVPGALVEATDKLHQLPFRQDFWAEISLFPQCPVPADLFQSLAHPEMIPFQG